MSKVTKGCLIGSAILGGIGLVLCIVAVVLGVSFRDFAEIVKDGNFSIGSSFWGEEGEEVTKKFAGITKLEMNIDVAEVTINIHEGDEILVQGENVSSQFKCEQNGSTLEIEENTKGWKQTDTSIDIFIPEGIVFEDVDFEIGVGSLTASDLKSNELSVDAGVGEASISGEILKSADLKCGVGSITMQLAGKAKDFNYELKSGVGDIRIGENHYSGVGNEQKIDNGGSKSMEIECGVGEITVEFEEE